MVAMDEEHRMTALDRAIRDAAKRAAAKLEPEDEVEQVDAVLSDDGRSVVLYIYSVSGAEPVVGMDLPAAIDPDEFDYRRFGRQFEAALCDAMVESFTRRALADDEAAAVVN
jgi:hypothetical protein